MAVKRLVVDDDDAGRRDDTGLRRHGQRVDLDGLGVELAKDAVKRDQRPGGPEQDIARQSGALGDLLGLEGLQAEADLDRELDQLVGVLVEDRLDLDAAKGREQHHGPARHAVEGDGGEDLALDLDPLAHQHPLDREIQHRLA